MGGEGIGSANNVSENSRGDRLEEFKAIVPTLFKGTFERAFNGTCSPRTAIKAKCQDCVGYEDTIDRVKNCKAMRCPLWAYRPYRVKQK